MGLVLEWISLVVPSLSLVTGLLFWFGWTFSNTRAPYFGFDYTVLQFTTVDYLIRSVEAVFVPGAILLIGFIIALLLHGFATAMLHRVTGTPSVLWWLTGIMTAAGVAAGAFGVWAMFVPLPVDAYLLPPLLQGGGAAVAAYSLSILQELRRRTTGQNRTRLAEAWPLYCYSLVVLLVILNLFWATSMYAGALGTGKAQELAQRLSSRPVATIYSKQSLALGSPVREEKIEAPASLFGFKYTGLRLLIQASGEYFLLSENWTRESGIAVALRDSAEIRLELEPGGAVNE